jgi:hypothetical protein
MSVKITGDAKLKENIAYLREHLPLALAAANLETAEEIAVEARANVTHLDAFDTGALFESIQVHESPKGMQVVVFSDAKHAPFIEFGTAPHFPPLAAIRAWCIRKGIPEGAAFPIARAISERGTPERPWLYPAYKWGAARHVARIRRLVVAELSAKLSRALAS